jgi:hypothetical protein
MGLSRSPFRSLEPLAVRQSGISKQSLLAVRCTTVTTCTTWPVVVSLPLGSPKPRDFIRLWLFRTIYVPRRLMSDLLPPTP